MYIFIIIVIIIFLFVFFIFSFRCCQQSSQISDSRRSRRVSPSQKHVPEITSVTHYQKMTAVSRVSSSLAVQTGAALDALCQSPVFCSRVDNERNQRLQFSEQQSRCAEPRRAAGDNVGYNDRTNVARLPPACSLNVFSSSSSGSSISSGSSCCCCCGRRRCRPPPPSSCSSCLC